MNAYFTSTNTKRFIARDSDAIRRAYIANTRKQSILRFFSFLLDEVDSKAFRNIIFAIKAISGLICAISFFAVIGMIDRGSISVFFGIVCTVLIAALESLCFIPIKSKNKK